VTTMSATLMDVLDPAERADPLPADPSSEALRLFDAHGQTIYRFCRSTTRSAADADDVVQETFLKLLHHLNGGGDRTNLRAWLFAVAANACRDRLRGRARWLPWRIDQDERAVEPQEPQHEDAMARRRARTALRALPSRDRLLLSLRAQGLSYRDIAAAAGVAATSVGTLLTRAMDRWTSTMRRES